MSSKFELFSPFPLFFGKILFVLSSIIKLFNKSLFILLIVLLFLIVLEFIFKLNPLNKGQEIFEMFILLLLF